MCLLRHIPEASGKIVPDSRHLNAMCQVSTPVTRIKLITTEETIELYQTHPHNISPVFFRRRHAFCGQPGLRLWARVQSWGSSTSVFVLGVL